MKFVLPILIVAATVVLAAISTVAPASMGYHLGVKTGTALPGLAPTAHTPEQAIAAVLSDVRRRDYDAAYNQLANTDKLDQSQFSRDMAGASGSLRTLSNLESWDLRPLHATGQEAQIRVAMHWASAVGPLDDVRDLRVLNRNGVWKVVWPPPNLPDVPAQVIPVNFLRWDLVSSSASDGWGERNVDAPHVRIISMNAVEAGDRSVIMGEVVNEDTVPAFVNVNATLIDQDGNPIGEESSFDKIAHVLLPKQVSPYRIDFLNLALKNVRNVRMDVKATLIPASADPVIGVMDQDIQTDAQGRKVLIGKVMNESGQVVNIPHVIATFYDNNGRVIWVSDGYVDRALFPQIPEPFAVEVPADVAAKVHNYHVVVNQYSLGKA